MNSWIPSHIQVTVHQARDLALKSKSVHSEVYVLVQVEKERQLTTLLPRHTCPQWNETFDIPLMSLDSAVDITVRQKGKFSDDFIGHITIPFTNLTISRRQRQNWHKLGPKPGKTNSKLRGDLLITTSFLAKWNSKESNFCSSPVDIEVNKREGRMLRRSKSEYKSSPRESPKHDRSKSKGIFTRSLRKKNSQVFEDCEDDFIAVSVHTPGSPPTPRAEQRKQFSLNLQGKQNTSSSSLDNNLTDSSQSSGHTQSMFSEATILERNGIVDLALADPQTRLEQGRRLLMEGLSRKEGEGESDGGLVTSPTKSPILQPHSLRKHHHWKMLSRDQSSFDSSFESDAQSGSKILTSTPSSTLPITYRAKSTPRRRDRLYSNSDHNHSNDQLSPNEDSNISIDQESSTSEYYSSSSVVNTPSNSNTLTSPNGEITPINQTHQTERKLSDGGKDNKVEITSTPIKRTLNTETGEVHHNRRIGSLSSPYQSPSSLRRGKLRRGLTVGGRTLQPSPPRIRSQVTTVPVKSQENASKETESSTSVQSRKKFLSEATVMKRHSADIAQLIRLNNSTQGKNDGLDNVLNTGKLRQLLQKQSGLGDTEKQPVSQPTQGKDHLVSKNSTHSPPLVCKTEPSPPRTLSTSSSIPQKLNNASNIPKVELLKNQLEPESQESSSVAPSSTTSNATSLESSFSSEYQEPTEQSDIQVKDNLIIDNTCNPVDNIGSVSEGSISVTNISQISCEDSSLQSNVSISIENSSVISSRSTTPSQMSPPLSSTDVTRESTPSPEHNCIDNKDEVDGPQLNEEQMKDKKKRKHTVEYKKSLGTTNKSFQPVPPLPPSIANNRSSMLPNHRSYSSTTDITALLAQYRDSSILSPPTSANCDMYNTRPSSQCSYSISTTSSGRTSPVIIEEEEVKEDVGNRKFLTPPTSAPQQGTLLSKSKQTYDSSSLPRRRQGGGLKRTLSLYQENRRQVAMVREKRGLERGKSFDVSSRSKIEAQMTSQISSSNTDSGPKLKHVVDDNESASQLQRSILCQKSLLTNQTSHTPIVKETNDTSSDAMDDPKNNGILSRLTLGSSFKAVKNPVSGLLFRNAVVDTSVPNRSSHETHHSEQPQENGSIPTTEPLLHFMLPPPPIVSHSSVAEQVSGVGDTVKEGRKEESHLHDNESVSSSCTSSDTEEEEELTGELLQEWSKELLIEELLLTKRKLKSKKQDLKDTNTYLDSLLAKVMEHNPELLLSDH